MDAFGEDLPYLDTLIGEGRIVAPVGLDRSWQELGQAVEALRERGIKGKAVLSVG